MNREKIWTKHFIFVSMSNFFMALTFYILATVFPLYMKDILHGNQQTMGLTITVYVVGIVLLRPLAGLWMDRFGKKKMTLIGMAVFLIASISYFGANAIILFLIIRFIHGMSYGLASTGANTIAAMLVPPSRQGEGIGYFSMFMSLAMVIGPALGLFLWKDKNVDLLLVTICVISALSLIISIFINIPKAIEPQKISLLAQKKTGMSWQNFIEPKALPISIVTFFLAFSYSSLSGFLASFTEEIHQTQQLTSLFFVVFALMIVLFRPLVGKMFDRYTEHYLYYPAILLFSVGMLLLSQAHSSIIVLVAGIMMGIGYGALFPCFQTLAVKLSPHENSGVATATFFLLNDLGYGVGSYFMGMIASYLNYRMMYVVAGLITLISIGIYYVFHHRAQTQIHHQLQVGSRE